MKGLELCEKYFYEFGLPVLKEKFGDILPLLAAGLSGSGSECFGFDDDISEDHDFEPGFCIFLPDETVVDRRTEFLLERAYSKLPDEFYGYKRNRISPVGGNRHGVIRSGSFFENKTGDEKGRLSIYQWLTVPEYSLAEAVNGKVFFDGYGEFTSIREKLAFYPEDIRLKKLSGNLLIMGQSGQYNYKRCVLRKEYGAAQLALYEFVKAAMSVVFLLNKKYMPYYKWSFRAMRDLPILSELENDFVLLLSSDNYEKNYQIKEALIDKVCNNIFMEMQNIGIGCSESDDAEKQAYFVNDLIRESEIRNLHILSAV